MHILTDLFIFANDTRKRMVSDKKIPRGILLRNKQTNKDKQQQ